MKLWVGGEVDALTGADFSDVRNRVEEIINEKIASKSYGMPLDAWDCIVILRETDDFAERLIFSAKKRDMDFRLSMNYELFLRSDRHEREKLLFQLLQRSLVLLSRKKGIDPEKIEKLVRDVSEVGQDNNWC